MNFFSRSEFGKQALCIIVLRDNLSLIIMLNATKEVRIIHIPFRASAINKSTIRLVLWPPGFVACPDTYLDMRQGKTPRRRTKF